MDGSMMGVFISSKREDSPTLLPLGALCLASGCNRPTKGTEQDYFRFVFLTEIEYTGKQSYDDDEQLPSGFVGVVALRAELLSSGFNPNDINEVPQIGLDMLAIDMSGSFVLLWARIKIEPKLHRYHLDTMKIFQNFEAEHLNILSYKKNSNLFPKLLECLGKDIWTITKREYSDPFTFNSRNSIHHNWKSWVKYSPAMLLNEICLKAPKKLCVSIIQANEDELIEQNLYPSQRPGDKLCKILVIPMDGTIEDSHCYFPPAEGFSATIKLARQEAAYQLLREMYPSIRPNHKDFFPKSNTP